MLGWETLGKNGNSHLERKHLLFVLNLIILWFWEAQPMQPTLRISWKNLGLFKNFILNSQLFILKCKGISVWETYFREQNRFSAIKCCYIIRSRIWIVIACLKTFVQKSVQWPTGDTRHYVLISQKAKNILVNSLCSAYKQRILMAGSLQNGPQTCLLPGIHPPVLAFGYGCI